MEGRHLDALRGLYAEELAVHLRVHSGLPGPRGNLELADAFAAIADRATILRFAALDDEYLRFCGTEAIGRLIVEEPDDTSPTELLRRRAADDCGRSWPSGLATRTPMCAALPWRRSVNRDC